jgi:G:T-mismatch repair DNA endonuclease (very short patch repair protein)
MWRDRLRFFSSNARRRVEGRLVAARPVRDLQLGRQLKFRRDRAKRRLHGPILQDDQRLLVARSDQVAATPSTRSEFWSREFEENVARDARVWWELHELGWQAATSWECQIRRDATENTLRALSA